MRRRMWALINPGPRVGFAAAAEAGAPPPKATCNTCRLQNLRPDCCEELGFFTTGFYLVWGRMLGQMVA